MISVVIPAYNEERILDQSLSSLKGQQIDHPFEIIVVDNNSTDQTAFIAQKYGCRVFSEKRQGISWARLKGLHAAKGNIIVHFDADGKVPSDWLKNLTQPFFDDADVIFSHGVSKPLQPDVKSKLYFKVILFLKFLCQKTTLMVSGYNIAYCKEAVQPIIESKNYLELKHYEDTYIGFNVGKIKGRKVFVPSAVVFSSNRRIQKESLSQRIYIWAKTMLYYIFYREFPSWVYTKNFNSYR